MADPKELATCDSVCRMIFARCDAFPRLKDTCIDPLCLAGGPADGDAPRDTAMPPAPTSADDIPRGALVLRGPVKQLQVVGLVTQKGKAVAAAERFKPLLGRCKWVPEEDLAGALDGVQGVEGLQERRRTYDPSRQFIFILVAEFASGDVSCQHHTVTGQRGVEDRGPCEYVTDHGRTRSAQMPKFGYAGSLRPHRVTPDRPLPDHIPRTDYYTTGQAEKERQSDARNTPPVLRATASSACTVCVNVALTVSVFGAPLGRCFRRRRSRRCAASASSDARSSTPLTASCVRA